MASLRGGTAAARARGPARRGAGGTGTPDDSAPAWGRGLPARVAAISPHSFPQLPPPPGATQPAGAKKPRIKLLKNVPLVAGVVLSRKG